MGHHTSPRIFGAQVYSLPFCLHALCFVAVWVAMYVQRLRKQHT